MRIKLKYPDIDTFVQKYAVNISRGGIFIATKQPKPIGTYVRFEFLLSDASQSSIIRGEGQVQWTKEFDAANPGKPHGMGVKFMRLDGESQAIVDRALKWRAEHGTSPSVTLPASGSQPNPTAAREQPTARMSAERVGAQDPPTARYGEDPPTTRGYGDDPPTVRGYGEDPPTVRMGAEAQAQARAASTPDDTARMSAEEAAAALDRPTQDGVASAPVTDERTDRVTLPEALRAVSAPISSAPPPPPPAAWRREASQSGRLPDPPREELPDVRMGPPPGTRETRPIAIEHREEPSGRTPYESTRPITLPEARNRPLDEIDSLAVEWGLSEEKVARVLKRARPRMVEATAELERLLLKPPKLPTPTKAEALSQLAALLAKKPRSNP